MKARISLPTLRINPEKPIPFTYKTTSRYGLEGDTVATALFASGVRIFSRSLKYHRPRGLYSLDGECANTMMTVNAIPNVQTEKTPLRPGDIVSEQNVLGSARADLMGGLDYMGRFMPAGFYYKTMHKPAAIWPLALQSVRKAAGLGRIRPDFKMPGTFTELYPAADVCVIGGGPAGMNAALAAADKGLRVILLESRPWLGGSFDYRDQVTSRVSAREEPLYRQAANLAIYVNGHPGIRVFTRCSMVGGYNDNLITAVQQGDAEEHVNHRYMEIRATAVVVASGCRERPLIFGNNDMPGIMQPGCAHRLIRTYGILPGRRAVFSVGHDAGLEAAMDLFDLGVSIAAVADVRPEGTDAGPDPALVEGLKQREIPFFPGWTANTATGRKAVDTVQLCFSGGADTSAAGTRTFSCDLLCAAAGLTPVAEPLCLLAGRPEYDDTTGYYLPRDYPAGVFAAGRLLGLSHADSILASGKLAGLKAAVFCGADGEDDVAAADEAFARLPGPGAGSTWVAPPVEGGKPVVGSKSGRDGKRFICFDEDVTVKHIEQSLAQGFDVPELIKRFSAAGTGPGQGGISGHNLPLLAAERLSHPFSAYRPTTVRGPLSPVYLAAYAGYGHKMSKRTPLHDVQRREGGIFRKAGVWHRARYFSADLDVAREVATVRGKVGILDASTLGCFRIFGPDALSALQRVYAGNMATIASGRAKYAAMCNHDGCVIDDGVVIRTGDNDYMITTSSGRAGATAEWIRFQTRFDHLDFHLVNMTDGTGVINLAGPWARKTLEKIADADVSDDAFPFGHWRDFPLKGGIAVRSMRLGFVGELSYELYVPASFMPAVWEMLREAGREFGIAPFGVEAQNVLRLEKGHVILGQESEQRTNLLDLGLGFLWARDKDVKPVGADALAHAENDPERLKLVGIRMENPAHVPGDGSVIVTTDKVIGHIGTIRKSASVNAVVGMALIKANWAREGTRLAVYENECRGALQYATVVRMPFYDPGGKRMKM